MTSTPEMRQVQMNSASRATDLALREAADETEDDKVALLEALRKADVDPRIANRLGPLLSGAHAVANREEQDRDAERLLDRNETERIIVERERGRLCEGRTRQIACETLGRADKTAKPPHTPDEKREIRAAGEVASAIKSLGVGAKGIDALTKATAQVNFEDEDDDDSGGVRESMGEMLS